MRVLQTIESNKLLSGVQSLGVAVSGGSDSMALLHFLKFNCDVKIKVVNIEHGIRGESSKRDSEFVKNYCAKNDIEYIFKQCDCLFKSQSNKQNLELIARNERYDFFKQLVGQKIVDCVATAHNMNDNAESILLHLFRGCGLQGVCGMKYQTIDKIIRPLLDTDKHAIMNYIEKYEIPYIHDETNDDIKYSRNLLRKHVLPHICKINSNAVDNIIKFAHIANSDNEVLDAVAARYVNNDCVDIAAIEHPAIAVRAFKKALCNIGVYEDVLKTHFDSIMSLNQNGKYICLKDDLRCSLEYGKLRFYFNTQSQDMSQSFKIGKHNFVDYRIIIEPVQEIVGEGLFVQNCEKLYKAKIRYRRKGDYFKSCNGYTKTLNKFFTDKKIPKNVRDSIPLLCLGSEVLIIFGYEISDNIKVKNNDILRIRSTK